MIISVLVPSYQRPDFLEKCLASLARQRRPADEIVVITRDTDAATRTLVEESRALFPPSTVLRGIDVDEPGIVAAANRGMSVAKGDVFAFIDDDATAVEGWLELIEAHYADPQVAAVGGPCVSVTNGVPDMRPTRGRCLVKTWYGSHIGEAETIPEGVRRVQFLRGCNMSFRSALVSGFDVRLKPYWRRMEDDVLLPLYLRGLVVIYDPAIIAYHYTAPVREGQRNLDPTAIYGSHHNDTYVMLKHSPPLRRIVFLLFTFLLGDLHNLGIIGYLLKAIVKRRPARVSRECRYALRGKLDGIRSWREWRSGLAAPPS
jgi:glycosyltransferase involved in cell wall biosynthesis